MARRDNPDRKQILGDINNFLNVPNPAKKTSDYLILEAWRGYKSAKARIRNKIQALLTSNPKAIFSIDSLEFHFDLRWEQLRPLLLQHAEIKSIKDKSTGEIGYLIAGLKPK